MGQQQLLLLVLAAVIVGLAVVTGINMFGANAMQANEDAIRNDLITLAGEAQAWYRRPAALGGGGNTFAALAGAQGWTNINRVPTGANFVNANATYAWVAAANPAVGVSITGTSLQDHDGDGTLMVLTATVTPNAVTIAVTTAD
jgi:hypothetical protein